MGVKVKGRGQEQPEKSASIQVAPFGGLGDEVEMKHWDPEDI